MEWIQIHYRFCLPDNSEEVFDVELDSRSLDLRTPLPHHFPAWTKLEFQKCSNCPLKPESRPHCPLAASLVGIVQRFNRLLSYDKISLDVITKERRISAETSAQRAIGSLMGLVIATCGCPHMGYLKPMARFHIPLADREETVYRAVSMYLLAQYFLQEEGQRGEFELDGLKEIYKNVEIVNSAIIDRIRSAAETDSTSNALIVLDVYAKTVDLMIEKPLERIRKFFDSYFRSVDEHSS
jgi:hypothetical protein